MKTARDVIRDWIYGPNGPDGYARTSSEKADNLIAALKAEGFKIMNAEEFAKALKKGHEINERVMRQSEMIAKAQLKRLAEGLDVDP